MPLIVVPEIGSVRLRVKQHLTDVDGLAPVHEDLVALGQDGDSPLCQSLDEVGFPQRPRPVEGARCDPRDQLAELVVVTGAWKSRSAHVVGELEVRIIDPDRRRQPARDPLQPLPVARDEGDAVRDQVDQPVVVQPRLARVEDLEGRVVHRRPGGLDGQERQVPRPQPLAHVCPFVMVSGATASRPPAPTLSPRVGL